MCDHFSPKLDWITPEKIQCVITDTVIQNILIKRKDHPSTFFLVALAELMLTKNYFSFK